jgi:hypothetical protein
MQPARKPRGRPRKHQTTEEAKEAANAANRASRQRRKAQQPSQAASSGLAIEFDPRSLLRQGGFEGNTQITELDHGIQADGLNIPVEEERLQLLEVAIYFFFFFLSTYLNNPG